MLKVILTAGLLLAIVSSFSQSQPRAGTEDYDIARKRLLVQTCGLNLFATKQGMIDVDSAMQLACDAQGISRSTSYNEGYSDGHLLPGQYLIDNNKTEEAVAHLPRLTGDDHTLLLLQLAGYYLFKPGAHPGDLSRALLFLHQAQSSDSATTGHRLYPQILTMLGKYYAQAGNLSQSGQLLSQVVDYYRAKGNLLLLAGALAEKGVYLPYSDTSKLPVLKAAFSIYQQLDNKVKQVELVHKMSYIHYQRGELKLVITELLQSLAWQKEVGFHHTHYTHVVLSFLYNMEVNYNSQLNHAVAAVNAMLATHDTAFASRYYMRLGEAYLVLDELEDGLVYYKKAVDAQNENDVFIYKNISALCFSLEKLGRDQVALDLLNKVVLKKPPVHLFDKMFVYRVMGHAYYGLHQQKEAANCFLKAIAFADSISAPEMFRDRAETYMIVASFYANTGNFIRAAFYLQQAKMFLPENLDGYSKVHLYATQYKIDSASGHYLAALIDFQQFTRFNIEQSSHEVEARYRSEKKEDSIRALNRQAVFNATQLRQANRIEYITSGAIVLLVIVIVLVYNQYRLNRKNSQAISEKNESLHFLVEEKEWLLKEIHHRVKNNLQTITSLLESQSAYVRNDALTAIRDSQHRVQSMSLIHQKLLLSDDLASVDIAVYLHELVDYLKNSFDTRQRIRFVLEAPSLQLDVSQAVPLGLILNEAITNAVKYAFPKGGKDNTVAILIKELPDKQVVLSIADNGIGLPEGFEAGKTDSLGMTLMRGLCREIGADFKMNSSGGTTISVTFSVVRFLRISPKVHPFKMAAL